jgi:class 3 adenylate cyclase
LRRLSRRDTLLLALLGPLWILCASLHVWKVAEGSLAWVPVHVEAARGREGVPLVRGLLPGGPGGGLEVGDRVSRVGKRELGGAGVMGFLSAVYAEAGRSPSVPVRVERQGRAIETTLVLRPLALPWGTVPLVLVLGIVAFLALLRGRGTRAARAFALAGIAYSLHWSVFFGGPPWQTTLSVAVAITSAAFFIPLLLRATLLLPESGASPPRPTGWTWGFAAYAPATSSWLLGVPFSGELGLRLLLLLNLGFALAVLGLAVRGWRRADATGRRQLKWVALGLYLGLAPVVMASALSSLDARLVWLYETSVVATVAIPICFYIAIARHGFGDIDRLIGAATSYSILSALLLAALLTLVPGLAARLGPALGLDPGASRVGISLACAALLVPSQRWLRPRVERLVFRERFALEEGLARLLGELARHTDPAPLLQTLGERLLELLRSDDCVIYGRAERLFVPVFARGPTLAPAFEAEAGLAPLLAERAAPVDRSRWRGWLRTRLLHGPDAAALESIGPDLVVPVLRESDLAAFVCLGPRRSGAIYTTSEQAWLAAVADRVSRQLVRFDADEVLRESRALQQALRSYVPGIVAREIDAGREIEPREREVSVLFVDIRGYTAYAEGRQPEEIFSTVNAYTAAASRVMEKFGGHVVEFHGDGMMVVFGAPGTLSGKEHKAVLAACEVVGSVSALPLPDGGARLSVGVGVATGPAFVGSIESADRRIWAAIGNTTNLAARLQGLTRDLDAAVAIDAVTHERAGAAGVDFEARHEIRIRGRSESEEVWVLPRSPGA